MASLARGMALFFAAFTAASSVAAWRAAGDPNLWWLDVRVLPPVGRVAFFAIVTVALVVAAVRPAARAWRVGAAVVLAVAALVAVVNALMFYNLLLRGAIHSRMPLPFSLFVAATLIALVFTINAGRLRVARFVAGFVGALLVFPLMQVMLFGATDYRRPADLIVVFGARAYADGAASSPLADRVRTGVELYRARYASRLLFSGGPGDGAVNEPEAMRRLAMRMGVPESAILLDPDGLNTDATVRNTRTFAGGGRVLAVSHFYHLPRIKLAYQRAGIEAFTVPCETTTWSHLPYNVPRESVAFWAYYLRSFVTQS